MNTENPKPKTQNPAFQPAGRVVLRHIGDEHLLIPVSGTAAQSNRIYPLNETGAAIWEGLARGKRIKEIAKDISRTFNVTPEQAETDCRAFVKELIKEALLEPAA